MIITTTFQRKTFIVEAKQVKADDIQSVAEWCGGEYIESYQPEWHLASGNYRIGHPCIEIEVAHGNGKKMRAFVGDWITHISGSDKFKVYRDKTFKEAFEEVLRDFPEEMMRKIVREEMRELLKSLATTAKGLYNSADPRTMEEAGYRAIQHVIDLEEAMMPHAWNCDVRDPDNWDRKCSCGVGDDE